MPAIKLDQFGGQLPAWDPRLLPTGQGTQSQNCYLFSGALTGWRQPKLLYTLKNSGSRYAYRIPTITQGQAQAFLLFVGLPQAGDTFQVGEFTYTWRSALASSYDVLIGATTAACATNALAALTCDAGSGLNAGTLYGTDTQPCPDVLANTGISLPDGINASTVNSFTIGTTAYACVQVCALDFGSSYNSIPVAESTGNARTTWLKDVLALADTTTTFTGGINPTFSNDITASSLWLEFADQDTNVVKSPVTQDAFKRYYFASPSQRPQYNTTDRIAGGSQPWLLGVPAPRGAENAAAVSVTGGGTNLELGNPPPPSDQSYDGGGSHIYGELCTVMPVTPTGVVQVNDIQVAVTSAYLLGYTDGVSAFVNGNRVPMIFCDASGNFHIPWSNICGVIYKDADGRPGELLAVGEIVSGPINNGMPNIVSSFTNPVTLTPGQQYWIGFAGDTEFESSATGWIGADGSTNSFGNPGAPDTVQFPMSFTAGPPAEAPAGEISIPMTAPPIMWADCTAVTSGSGEQIVAAARAYVYTYVTEYGEEGAPSSATVINGWENGVWTVGVVPPPPSYIGRTRNIQYVNIYRTVVGSSGSTVFFYVCTLRLTDSAFSLTGIDGPWYSGNDGLGLPTLSVNGAAITALASSNYTFTDTLPDNYVALNNELQSTTWFPPADDLQGLTALPNGMIAGFRSNEVWFCQPYYPHAWPPGYVLTTEYPIVGLGVVAGALVVCTTAYPYVVTGVSPGTMSMMQANLAAPCLSRGSILSGISFVTYMSPNGLVQVGPSGAVVNTTDLWFTREKWQQLTPQKYTRAIELASCYFCFGTTSPDKSDTSVAQEGFTIELAQDASSFTIWPQPGGHRLGFTSLSSMILDSNGNGLNIDNVLLDQWTGIGLLIGNGGVYYYDFTDPSPFLMPYTYASKILQQNNRKNFEAMRVFFDVPPNTPPQNAEPWQAPATDASWNTLGSGQYAIIQTYADVGCTGDLELVSSREVRRSGGLLRLPSGFKAEQWQWVIQSRVNISNIQIATSVKELANV